MSFSGCYDTDTTQIVATGDHDQVARVELNVVLDLQCLQVDADGVVDFDVRVRVADRAAVVCDQHGHTLGRYEHFFDFAQFVLY